MRIFQIIEQCAQASQGAHTDHEAGESLFNTQASPPVVSPSAPGMHGVMSMLDTRPCWASSCEVVTESWQAITVLVLASIVDCTGLYVSSGWFADAPARLLEGPSHLFWAWPMLRSNVYLCV